MQNNNRRLRGFMVILWLQREVRNWWVDRSNCAAAAFNDHSRMETREDSTTRVELQAWDRNRVQTKTGRLVEQQHGSTLNQRAARRNTGVSDGLTETEPNCMIGSSGGISGRNI
jgi:hypothetical protein